MKKGKKKKKLNKKKIIIISSFITIFIILLLLLFFFMPIVVFKKDIVVEVNSHVKTNYFVSNIFLGKIEDKEIYAETVGQGKANIQVKSLFGRVKNYQVTYTVKDTKGPDIESKDTLEIEINSTDDVLKNIKITDNSKLDIESKIEGDYKINELGDYKIKVIAKDKYNNKSSKDIVLKIIDTTKPQIEASSEITINVGTKIDLLKNVKVTDNSKENIKPSVQGKYDINKTGNYKLKYYAKDKSGNEATKDFTLKVIKKNQDIKETVNKTIKTSKGYTLIIKNGVASIDGVIIANKTYSLPSTYGNGLTSTTSSAFKKMQTAAKNDGLSIYISSGFRSYQTQVAVYNSWVQKDGKSVADTYSARPGYSEHQTGLAMDLNTINQSFANTKEYKWLQENAYKYGFIMRYPKNKQNITGYIYEPWHYRYVGESLAKTLYNNGNWITIEEHFGIDSKYQ